MLATPPTRTAPTQATDHPGGPSGPSCALLWACSRLVHPLIERPQRLLLLQEPSPAQPSVRGAREPSAAPKHRPHGTGMHAPNPCMPRIRRQQAARPPSSSPTGPSRRPARLLPPTPTTPPPPPPPLGAQQPPPTSAVSRSACDSTSAMLASARRSPASRKGSTTLALRLERSCRMGSVTSRTDTTL